MGFTEAFGKIRCRPTQKNLYVWIKDDHVLDEGFEAKSLAPDKGYFRIKLAEMFLRDAREYWREFVPLTVFVTDFLYADDSLSPPRRHAVPFIVGSHLLKQVQKFVEGKPIEFRNTRVAGWVPYRGEDVGLFVGLYRMEVDNLANNLLDVLQSVVGTFDITRLSGYLDVARTVTEGITSLMGMDELEFRAGNKDQFNASDNNDEKFREGYRVYINCAQNDLAIDELWVKGGRLYSGKSRDSLKSLNKYDYCLVRIELEDNLRPDYETLDFHRTWLKSRARILRGEHAVADAFLLECLRQISESPDLTEDHQNALILTYKSNYLKAIEKYNLIHEGIPAQPASITRGPKGTLPPRAAIQKTRHLAKKKTGIPKSVLDGLDKTSENWNEIFGAEKMGDNLELTSATINSQIKNLLASDVLNGVKPRDLADAITFATLSAS